MIDVLIGIALSVPTAVLILYGLEYIGAKRKGFHVAGPGEVYCPTCDGTCREIEQEQAALSEFE